MNRFGISRLFLVCGFYALTCLSTATVHAADMKDNPKYQAWANFKPGSTSTIVCDMKAGPTTVHMEIKRTLISIDGKEAVVETTTTATVMGQDHSQPATKETIAAKTDKDEIKGAGEKDVEAMGKTFKCKVWERAADATAKPNSKAAPGMDPSTKATVYSSEDVPGGIVKMEATGRAGTDVVFTLSAMEKK